MVDVVVTLHPAVKCIMEWHGVFMSASAVSKYTQKLTGGVGVMLSRFFIPTTAGSSCSTPTTNCDVLRRGAATDLMEEGGDALAAPRSAYVPGERSI